MIHVISTAISPPTPTLTGRPGDRARSWALLLALILPGLIGGCRPVPPPHDGLRFGLATPPRLLDPRLATDAASARVNRLIYRALVELDARSLPRPGIASWEQLTPTRYRVTLGASGRDFADGTRLDARDVAATYRSILDPATGSPHRATLSLIQSIQILDADRLEFELSEPDALFPTALTIGILPAAVIEGARATSKTPIGSGPFRVLAWPEPGRLLLERRHDALRLEFTVVKDPSVRVMKLLRGEIQMLQNDLSPELVEYLAQRPAVVVETHPGSNLSYLGFNLQDPATAPLLVRRAIAMAIDREALLRHLLHDRGRLAETLLPPEHWAGVSDVTPWPHDLQQARALLAAAGYGPDRPLRLTYKSSADPTRIRFATALQSQLAAVGIELRVRSYDWGTFFGDIKEGRFQAYGLTWVGIRTPDIFRYDFHSRSLPPDGANRGRFSDPTADRLIETARAWPDLERQAQDYRALQRLLHRELAYLPLWYESHVIARAPTVVGYRLAADGNYDSLAQVRYAVQD